MRSLAYALITICFLGLTINTAQAAWFWGKKDDSAQSAGQKETSPAVDKQKVKAEAQKAKDLEAKRAAADKKRQELNNTEWQIELVPMSGKGKPERDVLTFKAGQVMAGSFYPKGFTSTNFSLSVQPDGVVIWETMQNSEKNGTLFWRGELSADMSGMKGILSYHVDDKTTRDYSFVSVNKKSIVP